MTSSYTMYKLDIVPTTNLKDTIGFIKYGFGLENESKIVKVIYLNVTTRNQGFRQ